MRAAAQAPYQPPLPSIPLFTALRKTWLEGYSLKQLRGDVLAGLTVGTVAVPLSMALAIATGIPPQHGLYTAIVAGLVAALAGGARFNVSGPTAAFVVILLPIVGEYGIGGLLLATLMAGGILIALGLGGMGRTIAYIPYPVVLGFTSGIALVIATLQLAPLAGIESESGSGHVLEQLAQLASRINEFDLYSLGVGTLTLTTLLLWPRLRTHIPAPLAGLAVGAVAAALINAWLGGSSHQVSTIASTFEWTHDGEIGQGVPAVPPQWALPWTLPGPDGSPLVIDWQLIRALVGPAFAIAMLGAIESLLCSVIADGMTRTRHDSNGELVGQGLANVVAPFFGGMTATAALARTATNIRSGAQSPLASMLHALTVLLAMVALAPLLGWIPMSALAALLLVVAWNMSEARHFTDTLRSAPAGDVIVLCTCFGLTVLVDMVVAVGVGTALAAGLFIRRMASLTHTDPVPDETLDLQEKLPEAVAVYEVSGPLFFAAADRALSTLRSVAPDIETVILDMREVPSMDMTAIVTLKSVIDDMHARNTALIFAGLPTRMIHKLRRAGIHKQPGKLSYRSTREAAILLANQWRVRSNSA